MKKGGERPSDVVFIFFVTKRERKEENGKFFMKRITKRLQNPLKRLSKHSILSSNIENMNEKRNGSWLDGAYILVNLL